MDYRKGSAPPVGSKQKTEPLESNQAKRDWRKVTGKHIEWNEAWRESLK